MSSSPLIAESAAELARGFSGQVLRPEDQGYDDARKVHNGLVDKRPILIARCRGTADVVDAVKFASTHDLEIAVSIGHLSEIPIDLQPYREDPITATLPASCAEMAR